MTKLERSSERALRGVDPGWDTRDTEIGLAMLRGRIARRTRARRIGMGLAAVTAIAGLTWGTIGFRSHRASSEAPALASASTAVRFSDGSLVTRLDPDAQVSVIEAGPERIITSVERGQISAEVTPRPSRVFRVVAGHVVVEALGTAFTVERLDDRVGVSVVHGRVRVTWLTGSRELGATEVDWFPPIEANRAREEPASTAEAPAAESTPGAGPTPSPARTPSWKMLALEGRNREAYALLRDHRKSVRDPDDLLLAADVARLSGHPADAVPFLERMIKESNNPTKAAMAAFALGRVLMTSLGQPEKAALAFADARRRAQGGSLAEDALAREVEAWAQAGIATRARERAQEYMRFYPRGQRLRAVKTFGGLE
ncbi:MAG: FecR domain-containing protein [Polyangiaceae bacterium]